MDVNLQLKWQQEVDDYADNLVNLADNALSDEMMRKLKSARMRSAQFSNLLAVAQEAGGTEVIINWILFQTGRQETKRQWGEETKLGQTIVRNIKTIQAKGAEIAQTVYGKPSSTQIRQTQLKLLQQYAGYLRRWFVAKGGREK